MICYVAAIRADSDDRVDHVFSHGSGRIDPICGAVSIFAVQILRYRVQGQLLHIALQSADARVADYRTHSDIVLDYGSRSHMIAAHTSASSGYNIDQVHICDVTATVADRNYRLNDV